ncbi:MAG TPA: glycosyltransferase family 4 protein [Mucilaginibacter sp.]|nr:glycosyltransferase family 4 protein [Mucilaginibacter sp.]
MIRLAIVTTHPIQYYAPIFRLLHERGKISVKVFYTLGQPESAKFDPGFGRQVSWDIPLLDGYPFEWMRNTARQPGTRHFRGIITPDLVNHIERWQSDAVLVVGWAYSSHLRVLRHFKNKIPRYFRGDSTLLNQSPDVKMLLRSLSLNWVYHHVSHAFYVGINNREYFLKYGLKQDQLSFAPHAVDNDRFAESRGEEAEQLRLKLNIKPDEVLILFAGKFEPVKDLGTLLTAFGNLGQENVHLVLAGKGVEEPELKEQAKKIRLAGHVHFMGFQNQSFMPFLYQACDLFCLPSKSETWGLSINEAMACSKAVLVSDKVGCAPDLVLEGQNGMTFKSQDAGDLAKALKELTADKEILFRFGRRSRELINDWTFEKIATAIENTLTGIHEPA